MPTLFSLGGDQQRGLTLVEVVMAVAISSVMVLAANRGILGAQKVVKVSADDAAVNIKSSYVSETLGRLYSRADPESLKFSKCVTLDEELDTKSCAKIEFVSMHRKPEGEEVVVESICNDKGIALRSDMTPTKPACIKSCRRNYSITMKIGDHSRSVPANNFNHLDSGVLCFQEQIGALVTDIRFEKRSLKKPLRYHRNIIIENYQLASPALVNY